MIVSTTFTAKLFDSTYTISIFLIFKGFVYAAGVLKKYNLSPATIDGLILVVVTIVEFGLASVNALRVYSSPLSVNIF